MSSYGQFCGVARALDVVGDRWTLLIVRELLVGPRRFGELRAGLPGIATNLLTSRLRELEEAGVLRRQLAEPGEGVHYALTERGAALEEVVAALVRWSVPLMTTGRGKDAFQPAWLAVALPALLARRYRGRARLAIETSGTRFVLTLPSGRVRYAMNVDANDDSAVDATLAGPAELLLAVASGALTVRAAEQRGLRATGSRSMVRAIFNALGS